MSSANCFSSVASFSFVALSCFSRSTVPLRFSIASIASSSASLRYSAANRLSSSSWTSISKEGSLSRRTMCIVLLEFLDLTGAWSAKSLDVNQLVFHRRELEVLLRDGYFTLLCTSRSWRDAQTRAPVPARDTAPRAVEARRHGVGTRLSRKSAWPRTPGTEIQDTDTQTQTLHIQQDWQHRQAPQASLITPAKRSS